MVKEARSRGLKAPVLLMGYYNPLLSYGEERLLSDCKESGVNGFIVVDLPPKRPCPSVASAARAASPTFL